LDGQCNNRDQPLLGAIGTATIRLVNDSFEDGVDTIPKSKAFETARMISLFANDAKGKTEEKIPEVNSDMSTMIGQIMTHEMLMTKKVQIFDKKREGGYNCCPNPTDPDLVNLANINKYCMPINISQNDVDYKGRISCLNYIKSLKTLDNCKTGKTPLPINFHTPYIDCELIYNDGTLEHLKINNGKFAVKNLTAMKDILVGYDDRSQQLPGLFLYLNFYTKIHNLIFDELKKFKTKLNATEVLFETRKLVTGIYQKIFLDYVLSVISKWNLRSRHSLTFLFQPQKLQTSFN